MPKRTGKCFKCGAPSNPNGIGGALERCLVCVVEGAMDRREKWRAANPEKDKAAKDKYRHANKEKVYASKTRWRKANKSKWNETGYVWKRNNPDAMHAYSLKRFGLTPEKFREMVVAQNGGCAICGKPNPKDRRLCVDHCHETGIVRALLCVYCNAGLGQFKDSPDIMLKAIEYLKLHIARNKTTEIK